MHSAPSPRLLVTGNERYFAPIERLRVEFTRLTVGKFTQRFHSRTNHFRTSNQNGSTGEKHPTIP